MISTLPWTIASQARISIPSSVNAPGLQWQRYECNLSENMAKHYRPHMQRINQDWFDPIVVTLIFRRQLSGITQEELNDRIGCADGHLAKWEARMFNPSAYYLIRWCEELKFRLKLESLDDESDTTTTEEADKG